MKKNTYQWVEFAKRDLKAADELKDNVYIEARYPADMGLLPSGYPTTNDAIEIYTMAKQIFDKCLTYIEHGYH